MGPTRYSWKVRFILNGLLDSQDNILFWGHSYFSVDEEAEAKRLSRSRVDLELRASSFSHAGSTHLTSISCVSNLNRTWSLPPRVTSFYSSRWWCLFGDVGPASQILLVSARLCGLPISDEGKASQSKCFPLKMEKS